MELYYLTSGETSGPLTVIEFNRLVSLGLITNQTLVWYEGLPDWKPFAEVSAQIAGVPPPPPLNLPPLPPTPRAPAGPTHATNSPAARPAGDGATSGGIGFGVVMGVLALAIVAVFIAAFFLAQPDVDEAAAKFDEHIAQAEIAYSKAMGPSAARTYESAMKAVRPFLKKDSDATLESGQTFRDFFDQRIRELRVSQDQGYEKMVEYLISGERDSMSLARHVERMRELGDDYLAQRFAEEKAGIKERYLESSANWVRLRIEGEPFYAEAVTQAFKSKWPETERRRLVIGDPWVEEEQQTNFRTITATITEYHDEYFDERTQDELLIAIPAAVVVRFGAGDDARGLTSWDGPVEVVEEGFTPVNIQVEWIGSTKQLVGDDVDDYRLKLYQGLRAALGQAIPEFEVLRVAAPLAPSANISSPDAIAQSTGSEEVTTGSAPATEIPSPGLIADARPVQGGAALALYTPNPPSIFIFDLQDRKFTNQYKLPYADIILASNQESFFIYDRGTDELFAFAMKDMSGVARRSFADTPVTAMDTGWDSIASPLLLATEGGPLFLDPKTLRDKNVVLNPEAKRSVAHDFKYRPTLRFSGNGEILAYWRTGLSPAGIVALDFRPAKVWRHYQHATAGALSPTFDGRYLMTGRDGLFKLPNLTAISEMGSFSGSETFMAAVRGDYFLGVNDHEDNPTIGLYTIRSFREPFIRFAAPEMENNERPGYLYNSEFTHDRRYWLFPMHELLITIPYSNDRLVLRETPMQ